MSALAPRNSFRIADEQEWLESSDNVDLSPASVWAPDYEEEDETTLQGKRVEAQYIDLMSPNIEEEDLVVDTPRQVRILDESQVLPGEASFATVSLNQPGEQSVLKDSWEPSSTSSVDDYHERRSAARVRLLDESQVLAGEASFATVISGEHTKAHRHSPLTEFLVKTKLSLKQLVLAVLALLSVLALAAVIVLLSTTRSEVVTVSSAPPPVTVDTASQSVSNSITESPESILILNSQGGVRGSASPTQAVATVEETQSVPEAKLIERPSSDDSRKAPSSDAKSSAVRQEIPREVNSVGTRVDSPKERVIETKKHSASVASKAVKERAVVQTPNAPVSSEPLEARSKPATRQSEVPVTVENVETKTPPLTGGGERPRTVTRKPIP